MKHHTTTKNEPERRCIKCGRFKLASFLSKRDVCGICREAAKPSYDGPTRAEHYAAKCEKCGRWLQPQREPYFAAKCQTCWPAEAAPEYLKRWTTYTRRVS